MHQISFYPSLFGKSVWLVRFSLICTCTVTAIWHLLSYTQKYLQCCEKVYLPLSRFLVLFLHIGHTYMFQIMMQNFILKIIKKTDIKKQQHMTPQSIETKSLTVWTRLQISNALGLQ